jgi:uncharacterized protein (DUF983 family)
VTVFGRVVLCVGSTSPGKIAETAPIKETVLSQPPPSSTQPRARARQPFLRLARRALVRRCPECGGKKIFKGWWSLKDRCPTCGHLYAREDGYWVMAIIINTAVTEAIFGIALVVGLILTAPDVAWQPLLAIGLVTNLVVPVLFYPYSKTLWVAADLFMHPAGGNYPVSPSESDGPRPGSRSA